MLTHDEIRVVMTRGPEEYRWAVRWQYMRGDGFFDLLLQAAAHADDEENLARIGLGFPALARAVDWWQHRPGWAREVEEWARRAAAEEASRAQA